MGKSGYLGYTELLEKSLELENQLQAVMADKEDMQDQYNRNTDLAIDNLQVELEFYKTDNKTLKQKLEARNNELSDAKDKLEMTDLELSLSKGTGSDKAKEVEDLKQQRDSERKDKRRYRDKYDLQKKEIIGLKNSIDEKSKQNKTQKVEIEQLNDKLKKSENVET